MIISKTYFKVITIILGVVVALIIGINFADAASESFNSFQMSSPEVPKNAANLLFEKISQHLKDLLH